jgi:hypothetical protein
MRAYRTAVLSFPILQPSAYKDLSLVLQFTVNATSWAQVLENNCMRELALRETPRCTEVFGKVGSLLDFGNDVVVDVFLVVRLRCGEGLLRLGLATLEELFLSGDTLVRL